VLQRVALGDRGWAAMIQSEMEEHDLVRLKGEVNWVGDGGLAYWVGGHFLL